MKTRTLVAMLFVALLLALAIQPTALATTAAQATAQPTAVPTLDTQGKSFRVAAIMPSSKNDLSYSQSLYETLVALQTKLGADHFTFDISENMFNINDAAAAIRDYASKGYDLVIAHGSQYTAPVGEIAPDFPNVAFALQAGDTFESQGVKNVFAYTIRADEGGYVIGALMAKMSKSHVLGLIGPIPAGDGKLFIDGIQAGAAATDPTTKVQTVYINSFSDVALASQAAQTQIASGADMLAGTSQAMAGAINAVQEKNATWFGNQADPSSLAPQNVAASQVYDWSIAFEPMLVDIAHGTLGAKVYTLDLKNGGLKIVFNPQYTLADEFKQLAETTIQAIVSGTIQVGPAAAPVLDTMGKSFRVAAIMPSSKNDHSFSQSLYDTLIALQTKLGADHFTFDISENMFNVNDAAAAIRDYASKGYDLVIAHGSQYGSSVGEIAPDFPNVAFAWGTAVDTFESQGVKNVFAYTVRADEGGYVIGALMAKMSKSHVLGLIGPIPAGDGKLFIDGIQAGAAATDPTTKVQTVYINSFSDVALASQAAQTQIASGADMLAGTSQAMAGSISVVKDRGATWFGNQADPSALAPQNVAASQVYDWSVAFVPILNEIAHGTLGAKVYTLNLQNGGMKIVFNPDYTVPDEIKQLADTTTQAIIAGTVQVAPPATPAAQPTTGQ